jgi:hypothetical protein
MPWEGSLALVPQANIKSPYSNRLANPAALQAGTPETA